MLKKCILFCCCLFCFNSISLANPTVQIEKNNDTFKEYAEDVTNSYNNDKASFKKAMNNLENDTNMKKKEMENRFNNIKNTMNAGTQTTSKINMNNSTPSLKNGLDLNIDVDKDMKNLQSTTDSSLNNNYSTKTAGQLELDTDDKSRIDNYYNKNINAVVDESKINKEDKSTQKNNNYQSISSTKQDGVNNLTMESFLKTVLWAFIVLFIMTFMFFKAKKR